MYIAPSFLHTQTLKHQSRIEAAFTGIGLMSYLPEKDCHGLLGNSLDTQWEFCGGNVINDERRRFRLKGEQDFEEMEQLISWENLSYIGDMNMGATICNVIHVSLQIFCQFSENIAKNRRKNPF